MRGSTRLSSLSSPSQVPCQSSPSTPLPCGIMVGMKIWLIIGALALLVCLAVIGSRKDEPVVASAPKTSRGPSFKVQVVMPPSARPLFGILPTALEAKLQGYGALGFDNTSRGAEIGSVGHDRLQLSADGWDLSIETDGKGRVAPGTRLVFPLALGGKERRLRCRPADPAIGDLRTTTQAGSDELGGHFLVKLATCENDRTGKVIEWPPAPLTVRGSFEGLPRGRR